MGTPPPIQIANFSMGDTFLIMVIALVVLGPRRLPQVGKQIGKLMYEFRKASNDFKFQMEEELRNAEEADRRKKEEAERQRALAAAPPAPQLEQSASPIVESALTAPATSEPDANSALPASSELELQSAPEPPASIAAESPYSFETASEFPAEAARELPAATPEPASPGEPEATLPRIMPPSTGEKIAAERPGTQPQQQELFGPAPNTPANAPETLNSEAERSEPAAHHG
jgi:sec-independent protein translocase protein TatB